MVLARTALFAFAALTLATTPALAGDSYDLRKLMDAKAPVGSVVRVTEDKLKEDKAPQPGKAHKKVTYVKTVEKSNEDGPSQFVLSFESFEDAAAGTKVEVKGVTVQIVRKRISPKQLGYEQKVTAGTVAPALQAWLDAEYPETKDDKGKKEGLDALIPTGEIEVNKPWKSDAAEVATKMFGSADGMDAKASSVGGQISKVVKVDGHVFLKVNIEMKLVFNTFQGMGCSTPLVMELKMVAMVSATGDRPSPENVMTMTMNGVLATPNGDVPLEGNMRESETSALVE